MALSTPVAFIIFNRPDTTEKVFQTIRDAQPQKLLVIADGPRADRPGEAEKCAATRAIIDRVDWECEVLTNYSDTNLGCKRRVSSGLDWVFSQVEEAIILEDDCLPAPSFFPFCQTLLERYRNDDRVMAISGSNLQGGQSRTNYSYSFSKYNYIWGWASWRRAWQHYDVSMKTWPEFFGSEFMKDMSDGEEEEKFWTDNFQNVYDGLVDTWDYQWTYACWCQGALSIVPDSNLVSNIGFGVDATHTTGDSALANLPVEDIWEIYHPPFIVRHRKADLYARDKFFRSRKNGILKTILRKPIDKIAKVRKNIKIAFAHSNPVGGG
jgi:hypothetical protein